MFDRYLITAESARNISENGEVIGFAFDVRIGYYRGLAISMVEPFDITVDGVLIDDADVTFTVSGQTFTYEQMETRDDVRWEMLDDAILTVRHPGGLSAGDHEIVLAEKLRISYSPTLTIRNDRKTVTVSA